MINRYVSLFFIMISCLLLTGCWNYKEINSLYIIAGVAIDKVPNTDKYNVTTEFVNIKENERTQGFEAVLLEEEGDSIGDAVSKMIRISGKEPYWGHADSIIISEEAARGGVMPFLGLISRSADARLGTDVYISKGQSAKEVLEREGLSIDLKSYELSIMINDNKKLVRVPRVKVYKLMNQLSIPKLNVVLPTIEALDNNGVITNKLSGGAILNQGKLVGFLDEESILPYLFIRDEVKAGILKVKTMLKNPDDIIILDIIDSNTKIKPIYGDDSIKFDVFIKTEVAIRELTTMMDYISPEGREKLKKLAEESLEKEINQHIKDVKRDFGFDIFGFGNIIRQRNNKLWKTIEDDWDSIFVDMDVNINCHIDIKNSGHFLDPIKVAD